MHAQGLQRPLQSLLAVCWSCGNIERQSKAQTSTEFCTIAVGANNALHSVLICVAVVQNDIHSPATTIREALYFSAQCRLTEVDKHQLQEFVEEVGHLRMHAVLPSYDLISYPACETLASRILLAVHLG